MFFLQCKKMMGSKISRADGFFLNSALENKGVF
jgi:hypothetical protein